MLKYALLGFLSYKPMTGYDLENFITISTGHFWHARLSQIYMTLKKLEQDGLVTSHVEPQEGRPDRRVYTITEAGHADLSVWLAEPLVERVPGKDPLLLKLFFARPTGKQAILTQLRVQLDLHRKQLEVYRKGLPPEALEVVREQPELEPETLFWDATRRFGELYEAARVQWLEETIARIEAEFNDI